MTSYKAYLASLLLLGACGASSNPGTGETDPDRDRTAPVIEIDTPIRGTMTSDGEVLVSGRVSDEGSGVDTLTINGQDIEFGGDGRFSASITLPEGVTLIETIAVDKANQDASDLRAILNGNMADQGTVVEDAVVANVNKATLGVMGEGVEVVVEETNFTAIGKAANPIVDSGGSCLGAKVNIDSIKKGNVELDLNPTAQGVKVKVTLHNLDVDMTANFKAACIGGSTGLNMFANTYVANGLLDVDITNGGDIRVTLNNLQTSFTGFDIDVGALPDALVNLVNGPAENQVKKLLAQQINTLVPQEAEAFLSDFAGRTYSFDILSDTVDIDVEPTDVAMSNEGIRLRLDGSTSFRKVEGASFLSTPRAVPSDMSGSKGLNVGLADDIANQMLASLWASGMLEEAIGPQLIDQVQGFFGDQAGEVTATLALPPVVTANNETKSAHLTVGDLLVHIADPNGGTLVHFAISADIALKLEAAEGGTLKLVTDGGEVRGKLIEKSPEVLLKLDDNTVTAIAELAIQQVTNESDKLLGGIPIPSFGAIMVGSPSVTATEGYVLLDAELSN